MFYAVNRSFLNKREVSERTKTVVYKSCYRPIMTYGCESWALTTKHESRLQAQEMRYLRRVVGKTRRDRVRNQTIRESLNVEPLLDWVQRAQLKWFGHVMRMDDARYPKRSMEAQVEGRRPRGRRRVTWKDNISSLVQKRGMTWTSARIETADRDRWKAFIIHFIVWGVLLSI